MLNILIGIFYVALIALISYLLYYIIKTAIKDAFNEIECKIEMNNDTTFENTNFMDNIKDEKNTSDE